MISANHSKLLIVEDHSSGMSIIVPNLRTLGSFV